MVFIPDVELGGDSEKTLQQYHDLNPALNMISGHFWDPFPFSRCSYLLPLYWQP